MLNPNDISLYKIFRSQGMRACTAFIIVKYGWDGLMSILIEEE